VDAGDIDTSWRAGADAVLLIAALHDADMLAALHTRARARGMDALVEIHDEEDARKCRALAPALTGVNCRDLATFDVDLLHPLRMRPRIDWPTRLLFESGVRGPEDVLLARSAGYEGILVGETAVRTPERIPGLLAAFGGHCGDFWPRLCARMRHGRPLVKICGITRPADAEAAVSLGCDLLGFVFASSSPRRAEPNLLRELRGLDALKVAVAVTGATGGLPPEVADLLSEGLVDAVQLHGDETAEECASLAFPYYKAVRIRDAADVAGMGAYFCPRVLADAWSADSAGGTGRQVAEDLARAAGRNRPLWLAGGLGPDNVRDVIGGLGPELIDASSRLEESPGRKDRAKLQRFFQEISRACEETRRAEIQ
jgi:indole-3-glycerol phosphate synthase/phosphoribosylanthranilate isomerase